MAAGEASEAIIRTVYAALCRGDWAVVEAHPGYWQTRQVFPATLTAFPDLSCEVVQQFSAGEFVATLAVFRGTHRGPLFGIAPTGRRVEFQSVSMDQVVDDVVVQHNGEAGWFAVLHQLGALPLGDSERP
jgi:predicted ester cyclase